MSIDSGDIAYQRLRNTDHEDHRFSSRATSSSPTPRGGLLAGSDTASASHLHLAGMAAVPGKATRQKKGRRMAWLMINQDGTPQTVQMDKRQLCQVMGLEIPMRDLRLMDPALSAYESYAQILVRENAMVFCVEYVRLIISADKVLVPLEFEKSEAVDRFLKLLEGTIRERALDSLQQKGDAMLGQNGALNSLDVLPFELATLEVALGEVCRQYAAQVSTLEALAHPALDALTKACNTTNLERVRKIKTQHQRLTGRLQALKEVLERYMEDDQDMYRMCLSKHREQDLEAGGSDNTLMLRRGTPSTRPRLISAQLSRSHGHSSPPGGFLQGVSGSMPGRRGDDESSSSDDYHDLAEVENMLETYFMMVDSTATKLAGIGEYIDDTEDFINIELDYSRNRLLRIEILLTVATFALALYNLVAGVLGENLVLPPAWTANIWGFVVINSTTASICVLVFLFIWRTMKRKKLI